MYVRPSFRKIIVLDRFERLFRISFGLTWHVHS